MAAALAAAEALPRAQPAAPAPHRLGTSHTPERLAPRHLLARGCSLPAALLVPYQTFNGSVLSTSTGQRSPPRGKGAQPMQHQETRRTTLQHSITWQQLSAHFLQASEVVGSQGQASRQASCRTVPHGGSPASTTTAAPGWQSTQHPMNQAPYAARHLPPPSCPHAKCKIHTSRVRPQPPASDQHSIISIATDVPAHRLPTACVGLTQSHIAVCTPLSGAPLMCPS